MYKEDVAKHGTLGIGSGRLKVLYCIVFVARTEPEELWQVDSE